MKKVDTTRLILTMIVFIPSIAFSQALIYLDMQNPNNQGYIGNWEAQVNARNPPAPSETVKSDPGFYSGASFSFERSHEEGLEVFTSTITGQKALRATIADGRSYSGGTYDRAELNLNGKPGGNFRVGKLMEVTWSGYFESAIPTVSEFVAAMQLHGHDYISPANGIYIRGNMVSFRDRLVTGWHDFMNVSEMVNKVVTFKMTINCNDVNGYLKFEYKKEAGSWTTVMERSTGATKNPDGTNDNYIKLAGLYDYYRTLVDPNQYSRGKSYSLVTTNCTIADITNGPVVGIGAISACNSNLSNFEMDKNELRFSYSFPEPTFSQFCIYNTKGEQLFSNKLQLSGNGIYKININEMNIPGFYIVKLVAGEILFRKKMIVV